MQYRTGMAAAALATLWSCFGGFAAADAQTRDDAAAPNIAVHTPPIHLRQTGWTVKNGHPYVKSFYLDVLAACRKAGASIVPLDSDVVDKLGRTYYEIWLQATRAAIRSVSWGFATGDGTAACHFRPVRSARESLVNDRGGYAVNLDRKTASHDPDAAVVRYAQAPQTDAGRTAEARQKAAVLAMLRKQGYGQMADQAASTSATASQVAGQPCVSTRSDLNGTICVWSGGREWGFTAQAHSAGYITGYTPLLTSVDAVLTPSSDLILSATPPANGTGDRLTTELMTVGKPLEADVFDLPANVDIRQPGD